MLAILLIAAVAIASTRIAYALNTHSVDLERSSNQYLSAADSASLDVSGDMTMEIWIKRESTGTQGLITKSDSGSSGTRSYNLALESTGPDSIDVLISNGSTHQWGSVTQAVSTGVWHHIAAVYSASAGEVEFFFDGTSLGVQTGYPTSIVNTSNPVYIGVNGDGAGVGIDYFDGLVDEVRIWNVARTQTQINDDRAGELYGNETGLAAYWKMNNGLVDSSSNGNTLTNNGSATFSTNTSEASFTEDLVSRKNTNESLSNSSVLQSDNDLSLALSANKSYVIEGVIFASSTSATPDLALAFVGQSGSIITIGYSYDMADVLLRSSQVSNRISMAANTPVAIHVHGTVVTSTAGSMRLKWAQATADSAPTTVMAGSYLRAVEI